LKSAGKMRVVGGHKTGTARPRGAGTGRRTPPRRKKQVNWKARCVLACAAVVVGLFAWAAIARALAPKTNTSLNQFDVLIVLGDPADPDGNPTATEQARVTEAVQEYERGVAPRMIFTGGAVHNRFVEAEVMARTAEAQGIPASVILEDRNARNTIENACDSVQMMRSRGWTSAEVISSPYHLPRAAMIFSRLPVEWRVHAVSEPVGGGPAVKTILEIVKTVHYLVWSRQTEPCALQSN
jgi:uncharacterized SAM-binding protein YcdF (DUF218 family)